MTTIDRRRVLAGLSAALSLSAAPSALLAQQPVPPAEPLAEMQPRFGFDHVVNRAREIAAVAYEPGPNLPEPLSRLDFDAWRDIRFRPERALLAQNGSPFRMQMFHPGFLFTRPVVVNVVRDGVATPVPYSANLFDYGRVKFEKPLPVNLGFAGFRLHYPLNDPRIFDELISFIGASYFRVLGREQRYGLSARGLSIGAGVPGEEFPMFREFWVEAPAANAERVTIYALLDSPSVTGAYRFHVYPDVDAVVDVGATLFPRKPIDKLGLAPLTSMFFTGENDRRFHDDFRTELHDSDGLMIHSGTGEWIWRPLRNPRQQAISSFVERNVRGFGLMQRDRVFEHYQDLDLNYELRPSYWIEPQGDWGEGVVELIEIPTTDETNDNIVALWAPKVPLEPGRAFSFGYKLTAMLDSSDLHPGGRIINTYQAKPKALGSGEPVNAGARRFIVDFAGGDLDYHLKQPEKVEIVPSIAYGRIDRAFIVPNPKTKGFRAFIDIVVEPGQLAEMRAFLKSGDKTLTETWSYPWRADS
ncbi:MAG: glucan biosynthesis protein G [Bosea sp. (in: a-proteobacteria)]|uniref:glucan biosynthesis protein n=1 Tax=Bosea sp. (in: a-proteobacteria) TaxID=1871050 RepID=UPI001DF95D53|nr:glucan biosynthesis protein G [Bosea sp. (in: a-proteobacteria)]MBA4271267.1 glucan biosynthesis protein G [Methylobacterium sp.]MBX9873789.1 glucan biosynthesis protein G [Beijerinckiaceae bacterium]MBA4333958.1 glucan biosynthesis protein G [Methylobacterium sp.]MDP3603188.1 glucan biosynthesis protein G [Bosea sp. (in: a-proteobacteria)]WRH56228.1 MAG: glucan biosynthesis protein G [Bosea sp. (in: a-proteobacteria)]